VKFTCDAFPPVLLKSFGVLLSQFFSGVTNVGEKIKERGRAVPIDFDGNWPEMNLRLYSGVRMFTGNYLSSTPRALRLSGE
jgi:hypothetical protein